MKRHVQREFLFDGPESETRSMGGNSHRGNRETSSVPAAPPAGGAEKASCRTAATQTSEESDGPIVPQKRANNSARPSRVTWWRAKRARGEVVIVRYADDFVMGFQYRDEAQRCLPELRARFATHGLELPPEKTRLIEFGRFAAKNREARGESPPETFAFLGFTHCCGQTRQTKEFAVHRHTLASRLRRTLREIKDQLRRRWHHPIHETGGWLRQVVQGWLNYYAVPGNFPRLREFVTQVTWLWLRAIRRRSQKRGRWTWERMRPLVNRWLPLPTILHPYPTARLRVT